MLPELLLTLQRERDKLWPRAAGGTGETPVAQKPTADSALRSE
jgi:hypothetical protein